MSFSIHQVMPGVTHVMDAMGVCFTLLEGRDRALLVDTGYGTEDVSAFVRSLTDKPVEVILTHGHHDHILGACWFAGTRLFPEDAEEFILRTGEASRSRIVSAAEGRGLPVAQGYMTATYPQPGALCEGTVDLGGMTAEIIHCPGHTPGSAVVYVPERALLLSGDDWNPCTWLFFPSSLGVKDYLANIARVQRLPYTHVLCSHQPALYQRQVMDDFIAGLTDDALRSAPRVTMDGWSINTHQLDLPHGQWLVFDYDKAGFGL